MKQDDDLSPRQSSGRKRQAPNKADMVPHGGASQSEIPNIRVYAKTHDLTGFLRELPLPRHRPQDDHIVSKEYASEILMSDQEAKAANVQFVELQKLFFEYHTKNPNLKKNGKRYIPMQLYDSDPQIWKLFVGHDTYEKPTCTYEWIDEILSKDEATLKEYNEKRAEYKTAFLGGAETKFIEVDGVTWVVSAMFDLPWMIPVSLHYHNSKAVTPKMATWSEMWQCGRMVGVNERFYKVDEIYKKLFRKLVAMEKQIVFDEVRVEVGTETSLLHSWYKPCNMWYKPQHKLYAFPYQYMQYNVLLGIPRDIVERNLEKILIPKFTPIMSLCGEMRPCDYSVHERYAAEISKGTQLPGWNGTPATDLVATFGESKLRPGIANIGFFSNSTCGKVVRKQFEFRPASVGNAQGNGVKNAQYMYRHKTITTERDIKGQDMINAHKALIEAMAAPLPCVHVPNDIVFMAVEWQYSSDCEVGEYTCSCLSHCIHEDAAGRSKLDHGRKATLVRQEHTPTKSEVQGLDIDDSKKTIILKFLEQFTAEEGGIAAAGGAAAGGGADAGGDVDMRDASDEEAVMGVA